MDHANSPLASSAIDGRALSLTEGHLWHTPRHRTNYRKTARFDPAGNQAASLAELFGREGRHVGCPHRGDQFNIR